MTQISPPADDLISLIGNTPLVSVNSLLPPGSKAAIYAKLEYKNPGGSVKDRTALGLIRAAEKAGKLRPGVTIVESTSGNLGISLAMLCAHKKYKLICVVDPKIPPGHLATYHSFGAEIEIVDRPDKNGGYQRPRIERVKQLLEVLPNAITLDQYNNPAAQDVHYEMTGPEIYDSMWGEIDVLVGCVSTGGHLSGTARYLKEKIPSLTVIAVEPVGSAIFGGTHHPYLQNGSGLSFKTANYRDDLVDLEFKVSDKDAFSTVRRLAKNQGVLLGGSSGSVLHQACRYAESTDRPDRIVVLCPDGGAAYLNTIYNSEWSGAHGV